MFFFGGEDEGKGALDISALSWRSVERKKEKLFKSSLFITFKFYPTDV